jgi:hypothetical protein
MNVMPNNPTTKLADDALRLGTNKGNYRLPEHLTIDKVHARAEMTPLLKDMLEFSPAPRWDN